MLNINIEINNESIMSGHAKTSYVMWVLYMVLTDSYYQLSWPVSKSLEHDYVWSGVSQPEIEGDIRSSVSLPSVRFFPQTILICIENNNAALTRSYRSMTDRSIDDRKSSSTLSEFGIPQGSTLGPMLFNPYFAFLQDILPPAVRSSQYANDTTTYASCIASQISYQVESMNTSLVSLGDGSNDSNLALNSKRPRRS